MRTSEIKSYLEDIPQVRLFFRGVYGIDEVPLLCEDDFAIINTEYVNFQYISYSCLIFLFFTIVQPPALDYIGLCCIAALLWRMKCLTAWVLQKNL